MFERPMDSPRHLVIDIRHEIGDHLPVARPCLEESGPQGRVIRFQIPDSSRERAQIEEAHRETLQP